MIVLGVLFLVVGLAFAGTAVAGNWSSSPRPVHFLVATVSDWSTAAVFLAGMASAVLIALGLWLLSKGGLRQARGYRDRRRRERELTHEREAIVAERERYAVASPTTETGSTEGATVADPGYESAELGGEEPYPPAPAGEPTGSPVADSSDTPGSRTESGWGGFHRRRS